MVEDGGSTKGIVVTEVDELKRAWYNHVLNTLQKLDDRIDSVSSDLYKELYKVKEAMQKDLYAFKSDLQKDITSTKSFGVEAMEKIEIKINKLIDKLSRRIEILEKSVLKEELVKELSDIKQELTKDILDQKTSFILDIAKQKEDFNELLVPINNKITKIEIRLAIWAAIFGVVGTLLTNIILHLLPIVVKYFKG